jgi:hypothetical protein
LLETVTHGPRGNVVDVYTTPPWAALCDEVTKLKIGLREGLALDGDFRGLAARFAATKRSARQRCGKSATPAGFETGPEDRTKSKRCADLQNDLRALRRYDGVAREPLRTSGIGRNRFKWAPSGPEKSEGVDLCFSAQQRL